MCMCMHLYVYVYAYVHVYAYVCKCVRVYVCTCVRVYIYVCVCLARRRPTPFKGSHFLKSTVIGFGELPSTLYLSLRVSSPVWMVMVCSCIGEGVSHLPLFGKICIYTHNLAGTSSEFSSSLSLRRDSFS